MRTKLALIGGAMVLVLIWVMAQPVPVVRKLRDLSDAKPSVPPGNGDALVYNSTLGVWTNGVPTGAAGSNVLANSFTTNNPGQLPSSIPSNTNPLTPLMTRINDGTNVDALITAGSAFTTTRTNTTFLGPVSLSAQTNLLTMASGVLLLDNAQISSTASTPINNFYATNIFATNISVFNTLTVSNIIVTNITVQNNLTVSNLYTVNGNHNTLIVTNYVQMPWTTLTMSGTNVSAVNLASGSMFKLTLTNNAYFGVPSGLPGTSLAQTIQIHLLQDGTGTRTITMTNSAWLLAGSGASTNAVPTINTNANGITILTFATSPFSSTLLYGVPTAFVP